MRECSGGGMMMLGLEVVLMGDVLFVAHFHSDLTAQFIHLVKWRWWWWSSGGGGGGGR